MELKDSEAEEDGEREKEKTATEKREKNRWKTIKALKKEESFLLNLTMKSKGKKIC
jgi:hypothetical protein